MLQGKKGPHAYGSPVWLRRLTLGGLFAGGFLLAEAQEALQVPAFLAPLSWHTAYHQSVPASAVVPCRQHPQGIIAQENLLCFADTYNHRTDGPQARKAAVRAVPIMVAAASSTPVGDAEPIRVPVQQVQAGIPGHLVIDLQFPDGYHLNSLAPFLYETRVEGEGIRIDEQHRKVRTIAPSLPFRVPFQAAAAGQQATLDLDITFYYCRDDDTGVCVMQSVRWLVPFRTMEQGTQETPVVSYKAVAPQVQKSF